MNGCSPPIWAVRSRVAACLLGVVAAGLLVGCFSSGQAGTPLDTTRGEASYYGDQFVGETTASGEPFDPSALTAAHRSLPFGTKVRVTRIDDPSAPSVVVRINDRGPYKDDRLIDVSRAAARKLDMIGAGVVEVELEVVDPAQPAEASSPEPTGQGW